MPRRGTNIYKRKDGRWEGRVKREGIPGERRKYISFYGKTYHEVKEKMLQAERKHLRGRKQCPHTIEEMVSLWLEEQRPYWKETTYATYRQMAVKHIYPRLGGLKAGQLTDSVWEEFVRSKKKGDGGSTVSNGYLHNICSVLVQALSYVKKRYHYEIEIPDISAVKGAKCRILLPGENKLASLEQYLLSHPENDNTNLGILLAMHTGIRLGELCALTWEDIDLEEETLYIRKNLQRVRQFDGQKNNSEIMIQTPKTENSLRVIPLPGILAELLKEKEGSKEEFLVQGKKNPWAEPRTLQYRFANILKKCEIEPFNFHKLRHCFATRCIAKGFDIKSLSEILGHSSIQITLNLYVHSSMNQKKRLMNLFDFYQKQQDVV